MAEWLYDVRKACKKGAPICLFIDWRQYPSITDALQWAGWIWRGTAVWDKGNSRPQKGRFRQQAEYIVWGSNGPMPINRPVSCLPGVFRYGNPQNRIHVTEKPLQLMEDVIQICEPGGLILDPFAGAGTTVLAAVVTGYRAVGIEVTDAYYKLGSDRVKIALEAEQKEDESSRMSNWTSCFYREMSASNWMQEGDGAYGTGAGLCVLFSRRKPGKSAEILQKNL